MLSFCVEIGTRARRAALGGQSTFGVPEAAEAADWVARNAPADELRRAGADWLKNGAQYHELVRFCACAVLALDSKYLPFTPHYRSKVGSELEAALALWPSVLLLPTVVVPSAMDLIQWRAFPVHPLSLVDAVTWTDGALSPPSEFFFHDLDHARFKVREDLLIEGIEIPDAYQSGTTIDPMTGAHRAILASARGRIGDTLWARAASRIELARRLQSCIATLTDDLAVAAELLLFEILHEKSLPLDTKALNPELTNHAHIAKLEAKAVAHFFRETVPAGVTRQLMAAAHRLREALQ